METWPLGVFASVDAGLGVRLEVLQELGVSTIQIHAPKAASRTPEGAKEITARLQSMGIRPTAIFGGFAGESYADIPTVERTIGLVPPATREERLKEMMAIADFGALLDIKAAGLHIGFVPHDKNDPMYAEVIAVTRKLCDHLKKNGQAVHLETGQETAEGLLGFIEDCERDNLFVNFDPANMILYGAGEPIDALKKVGKYVRSVHCKDAKWAKNPGKEWGQEVPLGEGDVGFEAYLRTLKEVGYTGALTVEREIPEQPERQKSEIGHAIRLLADLKKKLL